MTLSVLLRFFMEDSVPVFSCPRDSPGPAGDVAPRVDEVLPLNHPQPDIVVLPHEPKAPGDPVSEDAYEILDALVQHLSEAGSATSPLSTPVVGFCPSYPSVGRAGVSPHDSGRFMVTDKWDNLQEGTLAPNSRSTPNQETNDEVGGVLHTQAPPTTPNDRNQEPRCNRRARSQLCVCAG